MSNINFSVPKLNIPKVTASKFVGPTYVKNVPKNFSQVDYKKISQYDYDNDGVVDYNTINESNNTGSFSGGSTGIPFFSSKEEFIKRVEPKFLPRNYTREQEIQILESIKEQVNQSVEDKIYNDFNAECRYKFGVDLSELNSITEKNEAKEEFENRIDKEKEYYKKYYTWLYFNNAVGSTYDNENVLSDFCFYFGTPWTVYEANSLSEIFGGFNYNDFISVMTEEEIAYYNYQFKIKYTEYYYSAELRDFDLEKNRKITAIEYARRDIENEMFHKQSFEQRMGTLAALKIVKNKYSNSFKEIRLDKSDEITMEEALHCQLNNETVLTKDGKFYKVDISNGFQLLRGPKGEYYTYYADTNMNGEFMKWFIHSFSQEPFAIFKGAISIFADADNLRAFNKSDYQQFYIDDVANRTLLGSVGYKLGAKTFDSMISESIRLLSTAIAGDEEVGEKIGRNIAASFWAVVGYGIERKRHLKAGYNEDDSNIAGLIAGGNLAASEFFSTEFSTWLKNVRFKSPKIIELFKTDRISDPAQKVLATAGGIGMLFSIDAIVNLLYHVNDFESSLPVNKKTLSELIDKSNYNISKEDKEILITLLMEMSQQVGANITFNDLSDLLEIASQIGGKK